MKSRPEFYGGGFIMIKTENAKPARANIKRYFTAQRIVTFGVLAALGYAISLLSFPLFPGSPVSFLKLDFSNVTTLLAAYMLGPVSATIIEAVKQGLSVLTSLTFGVGELANFLITFCFFIVPAVLYKKRKGIKSVILGMAIACAMQIVAGLVVNKFITFPAYGVAFGMDAETVDALYSVGWPFLIAFNAIKGVSVCIVTLLLYKRLSRAMKWIFRDRKKKTAEQDAGGADNTSKSFANHDKEVYNINMQKTITRNEDETKELARKIASGFTGGEVVLLSGDLGAGKTVFAKGVAEALGVKADVKSPTFTLSCEYEGDKLRLIHIDAYRLKNGEEAEACGLNERFGDKHCVCLIEWPSQIESVLPEHRTEVDIVRTGDSEREITIKQC